ncbi:MAG: DUF4135 domain-containing protein, partial [Parachlamydiaceae bacterium]
LFSRLEQDRVETQQAFGVKLSIVQKIQILGEETHNGNIGPIRIFSKNKTIIYKPRPMLAEAILMGKNGICAYIIKHSKSYRNWQKSFKHKEILSTYVVLDKEKYGYCENIENNQKENTIKLKYLNEYVMKFFLLEEIVKQFGVSDLHVDNIANRGLCPVILDGEVITIPTYAEDYDSHLLEQKVRKRGLIPQTESLNRIWLADGQNDKVHILLNDAQTKILENGINRSEVKKKGLSGEKTVEFKDREHIEVILEEVKDKIRELQKELGKISHRFVLIPTDDLKNLVEGHMTLENALDELDRLIQNFIITWGANILENYSVEIIREQFITDFFNNDVPVFYIKDSQTIYYGNQPIGKF